MCHLIITTSHCFQNVLKSFPYKQCSIMFSIMFPYASLICTFYTNEKVSSAISNKVLVIFSAVSVTLLSRTVNVSFQLRMTSTYVLIFRICLNPYFSFDNHISKRLRKNHTCPFDTTPTNILLTVFIFHP